MANLASATARHTPIVKMLASTPLPTEYGSVTYYVFGDLSNGHVHSVAVFGDARKTLKGAARILLRVHSSCGTSELFHATNCECREELDEAMKRISKAHRGIVIYLDQEGAGNGITNKIMAYRKAFEWKNGKVVPVKRNGKTFSIYDAYEELGLPPENRDFTVAAAILKELGVKKVRLMTNNPKKVEGLRRHGIDVEPYGIHIKPTNSIVKEHLRAKAQKLGHKIKNTDL